MPRQHLLLPVRPTRNLTEEVVRRIESEISAGRLEPGAKLPTESEMIRAMGVSRTVVREAVAALRARGLVITRQGAGAFVSVEPNRHYSIDPGGLGSLTGVLEVLELRVAIEVEIAALASTRASKPQVREIQKAHAIFTRAISDSEMAVREDFSFHRAIAIGSANSRFVEFLDFLGRIIIPRQSIRTFDIKVDQKTYMERIQGEHADILAAIERRAPDEAREAMRRHLTNSSDRYRQLAKRED